MPADLDHPVVPGIAFLTPVDVMILSPRGTAIRLGDVTVFDAVQKQVDQDGWPHPEVSQVWWMRAVVRGMGSFDLAGPYRTEQEAIDQIEPTLRTIARHGDVLDEDLDEGKPALNAPA